jgi:xanthine dehydrogenase accessory factor
MDERLTDKNIYVELPALFSSKSSCILATVTETYGSTPQKPGSTAIFTERGLLAGTVGGGAVELSVSHKSALAIQNGKSAYLRFNLENNISDHQAAICGGGMNVLLDASPEKHLSTFLAWEKSYRKRISGVLLTIIKKDKVENLQIDRRWITKENFQEMTLSINPEIAKQVNDMLNQTIRGDCRVIPLENDTEENEHFAFIETIVPQPRLLIAGAGHVGRALSHLAKLLDFEVIVWDERSDYANKENLPDADKIINGPIYDNLGSISVDKNTFIVIVTQGHKNDTEVLKTFIGSGAGYIGMIGSRNKISQVRDKFFSQGWATPEQWSKIHTPIGLQIHSKTVQEIALSIAAQLVLIRYQINHNHE